MVDFGAHTQVQNWLTLALLTIVAVVFIGLFWSGLIQRGRDHMPHRSNNPGKRGNPGNPGRKKTDEDDPPVLISAVETSAFTKFGLSVVAALVAAGVVALWSFTGTVARLDERVALQAEILKALDSSNKQMADRIVSRDVMDGVSRRIDEMQRRLDRLDAQVRSP